MKKRMKIAFFFWFLFFFWVSLDIRAEDYQNSFFAERRGGYSPELSAKDWIKPEEVADLTRDIDFSTLTLRQKVEKIYQLVRENFQFVSESPDEDFWQFPAETVRRGKGDCEDLSFLLVSLLISAGVPEEMVWINIIPFHVYVTVNDGETLILETDPSPHHHYIYKPQIIFNRLSFNKL